MGVARIYQYLVVDVAGRPAITAGSLSEAKSVSLGDGEAIDRTFTIGTESAVKLFDKTEDEALGDADLIWLEADLDVLIQVTVDAGSTDKYFVLELKGSGVSGTMGPALVLGSDLAHKMDGSIDTFDGTEDTIDEIWIFNEDDTDTARVRLVVAT